jgi:hypothetical protein
MMLNAKIGRREDQKLENHHRLANWTWESGARKRSEECFKNIKPF